MPANLALSTATTEIQGFQSILVTVTASGLRNSRSLLHTLPSLRFYGAQWIVQVITLTGTVASQGYTSFGGNDYYDVEVDSEGTVVLRITYQFPYYGPASLAVDVAAFDPSAFGTSVPDDHAVVERITFTIPTPEVVHGDPVPFWNGSSVVLFDSGSGERLGSSADIYDQMPPNAYQAGFYNQEFGGYYWVSLGRRHNNSPLLNWARYPVANVKSNTLTTWQYFSATGPLDDIIPGGALSDYELPGTVSTKYRYVLFAAYDPIPGYTTGSYKLIPLRAPITGGEYEVFGTISNIFDGDDESFPEAMTVVYDQNDTFYWITEGNYIWKMDKNGVKTKYFDVMDADTVVDGVYTDTDFAGGAFITTAPGSSTQVMVGTAITEDHAHSFAWKLDAHGNYSQIGPYAQDPQGNRVSDFENVVYAIGDTAYTCTYGRPLGGFTRYLYLSKIKANSVEWNYVAIQDDTGNPQVSGYWYGISNGGGSNLPPPLKLFQRDDSEGIRMSPRLSSTGNQPSSIQTNQAGRIPHGGNTYL